MNKIRVGIADDHPFILLGVEHLLRPCPDIQICLKSESIGRLLDQLVTVPGELGQLHSLQRLNLHRNQLVRIPGDLGQLSQLQHLNLHGNQLTSIPPEMGQLHNLQRLHLHANR